MTSCEVLLGQSYYLRFDPKLFAAMQPYPPLGTLYAASYLREKGYRVRLFDAMLAESEAEWAAALDHSSPRFAVIYEDNFNYLSKMCLLRMRTAAFTMIAQAKARGCTVIVAGADPSDHAGEYLAQGADYVVVGEGERTLGELLDALTGRAERPLESILGLCYRQAGESSRFEVRRNPPRPDIRDLDALPFPAWDLVDLERYRAIWMERRGYFSMNVVTTRGCPYHCNWCAKPIWGQRYNVRSPENVVAELRWLAETYRPDHIWFVDDIFGLKPGWLSRFASLLQEHGLQIPFKCLSRADLLLRDGEIEALRRAGCRSVWLGAESGSQRILDAMDKGIKVEQIHQSARRLHSAGVRVGFFLQFGYPGEGRADIEKTLQLVREAQPDDIGMSVSYPLPGTKFHAAVHAQLGARQNWVDSEDLAMLYQGPYSTAFYRQLHRVLHREFRARKAWQRLTGRGNPAAGPRISGKRQETGVLRSLAALLSNGLALPLERWRLNRLEKRPDQPIEPMVQRLSYEAAATPARQEREGP